MFIQFFTSSMGGGIALLVSALGGIMARNGVGLINAPPRHGRAGRPTTTVFCAASKIVDGRPAPAQVIHPGFGDTDGAAWGQTASRGRNSIAGDVSFRVSMARPAASILTLQGVVPTHCARSVVAIG
jgi:hypothetical protein